MNIVVHENGLVQNRFNKCIALACAFHRMDDRQNIPKGNVIEENGKVLA